jgi:hypothetical protein
LLSQREKCEASAFSQDHRVLLLVMLVINSVRNFRRMQQQKARQLPKIPIQTILLSRNYPLNMLMELSQINIKSSRFLCRRWLSNRIAEYVMFCDEILTIMFYSCLLGPETTDNLNLKFRRFKIDTLKKINSL